MYIIGGELKGRRLVFTKNPKVRPMTQLVREALFNIWRDHVTDAVMLDLFCGSGSVGIEAISRGAGHVDFVDLSINEVKQNANTFGIEARCSIFRIDALKALDRAVQNGKTYDLVFVGAPYPYPHLAKVLESFDRMPLLRPGAILTVEHEKGSELPTQFNTFNLLRAYSYGQTLITLFQANSALTENDGAGEKLS
jgi:16S rRNA (guanine(966)-N(2))-methyltransferase RsmD